MLEMLDFPVYVPFTYRKYIPVCQEIYFTGRRNPSQAVQMFYKELT